MLKTTLMLGTRTLLLTALAAVTACSGSTTEPRSESAPSSERIEVVEADPASADDAPSIANENLTAPALDDDKADAVEESEEAEPALINSAGRARLALATSTTQSAIDHVLAARALSTQVQLDTAAGDLDAAQLGQSLAATEILQAEEARVLSMSLLVDAAVLGACECDLSPEIEQAAIDGDEVAQALVDACAAAPDVPEDEDVPSPLCDDLAASLDDVEDLGLQLEEALQSCQSVVDAVLAQSGPSFCDDPASLFDGLPGDLSDAIAQLEEACAEIGSLNDVCEEAVNDVEDDVDLDEESDLLADLEEELEALDGIDSDLAEELTDLLETLLGGSEEDDEEDETPADEDEEDETPADEDEEDETPADEDEEDEMPADEDEESDLQGLIDALLGHGDEDDDAEDDETEDDETEDDDAEDDDAEDDDAEDDDAEDDDAEDDTEQQLSDLLDALFDHDDEDDDDV